jgi:hypothetical protein
MASIRLSLKGEPLSAFFSLPESTFLSLWSDSINEGIKYWNSAEKEKEAQSNNNNFNYNNKTGNIFDDEAILGDLSERLWMLTLDFINNQNNIDKHVRFMSTPDGEDDEDAGIDPDIDEEEEDEPLSDNRPVQRNNQFSLAFLLNPHKK